MFPVKQLLLAGVRKTFTLKEPAVASIGVSAHMQLKLQSEYRLAGLRKDKAVLDATKKIIAMLQLAAHRARTFCQHSLSRTAQAAIEENAGYGVAARECGKDG